MIPISKEYAAALLASREAAAKYRAACDDYRARRIGDAEFLAAKDLDAKATAAFDAAFAKEQAVTDDEA